MPDLLNENTKEIFQSLFDLYVSLDSNGIVFDIGGRVFEKTQFEAKNLIGQQFTELSFWQSNDSDAIRLTNAILDVRERRSRMINVNFRLNADKRLPMELNLSRNNLGGKARIFITGRVQRELELHSDSKKDYLLFAADKAEIGLWHWESETGIINATDKCKKLFEIDRDMPVTRESILTVTHPEDRIKVETVFDNHLTSNFSFDEEFRVVYSDGRTEWLRAKGESFADGPGSNIQRTGVVRIITKEKKIDDEMKRISDLERQAHERAVEANKAKDFFLAFLSHELRSPLNAILGWSKILQREDIDGDKKQNGLATIERSALLQAKLINDLLDYSRVTSGRLKLEYFPINLFNVVRQSFEAQRPAADASQINYTFTSSERDIPIFGDSNRLQQVFGNIISNAIKFTPDGGDVSVGVEIKDRTAIVKIKDSGQGITEDAIPKIFQQFSQGGRHGSRGKSGIGLGLSLVNILIAKHEGSVKAESKGIDQGSTFTVELPLNASKPIPMPIISIPTKNGRPLKNKRILIVEDDQDSREVLQIMLEQHGAVVVAASSASEAFNIVSNANGDLPNLIISDLGMPDEDGFSLIRRIRELEPDHGGNIPAIALSAFTPGDTRAVALSAGFQAYAAKPPEMQSFMASIQELTR